MRIPCLMAFGSLICIHFLFTACRPEQPGLECDASMRLEVAVLDPAGCESADGKVQLNGSGGFPPYQFQLGQEGVQSQQIFSGISAGEQVFSMLDSLGCEVTETVSIPTGTGYLHIGPVIARTCAIEGCHDGGGERSNFTRTEVVVDRASAIWARVKAGNMPPDSASVSLTSAEISLIGCWVENGAPAI